MRYKDLIQENLLGSENSVRDMLQTVIMSLASSDMSEIPTSMIAQELKDKMSIDVPYGQLMDMLNQMPIVDQATEELVSIGGEDDIDAAPEDVAKDKVAQMASNGVTADNSF